MNLDADVELSAPRHYRPHAEREQRIGSLIERMGTLLAPGDVVLDASMDSGKGPNPLAANEASCPRVLAFCPTPSALSRLEALGLTLSVAAPGLEVLREANSRAFCARLGQPLPGSAYLYDMETLRQFLNEGGPGRTLVVKRAFGFAGRERRRIIGGVLDPSTAGFAERSFRAGEGLQVEPWLARERDFALHGYLCPNGQLLAGPLMRQHCDPMGRWQRSLVAEGGSEGSDSAREPALSEGHRELLQQELIRSAHALHGIGYFGPFGIDAFEYRDDEGKLSFQPRSEINARFSMGFPRSLLERALASSRA